MDDLPLNPFDLPQVGPRLTIKEVRELIAHPGEGAEGLEQFVRAQVRTGNAYVRAKIGTGKTATALFELADVAALRIQRALIHLGVKSERNAKAASYACYTWPEKPTGPHFAHPILAALVDHAKAMSVDQDPHYYFRLDSGYQGQMLGTIYRADEPVLPNFIAEATILIPLGPVLDDLADMLTEAAFAAKATKH